MRLKLLSLFSLIVISVLLGTVLTRDLGCNLFAYQSLLTARYSIWSSALTKTVVEDANDIIFDGGYAYGASSDGYYVIDVVSHEVLSYSSIWGISRFTKGAGIGDYDMKNGSTMAEIYKEHSRKG